MSKPCSGLFYGTVGERTKSHAASRVRTPRQKTKNVDPNSIRFSQASVNGSNEIAENDPLPDQATKDRFTTPKGGEPQTWGEAVKNRIGKQSYRFKRSNPYGSYNMEKIN